jgi:hypothetical protein
LKSNVVDKADVLDLDAAWRDLASGDAGVAFQARRGLSSSPKDGVAFLRPRVLPIALPNEKRLTKLIAELDNVQFELRETAQRELEKLGETAVHACQTALTSKPSTEFHRRLEGLIAKQAREIWNPGPERLRALRAVEVLEMAGTLESSAMLRSLAEGASGAHLTEEAKSSQSRLAKRSTPE